MASSNFSGEVHDQDCDITQELDYITQFNESHGDRPVVIITAGKSGVGKSTLINTFLELEGEDATTAAMQPTPVSQGVSSHHRIINGVNLTVIDIPGLCAHANNTEDEVILEELKGTTEDREVDILLYCFNITTRLEKTDWDNIDSLTRTFGASIWKHAIFVLTWADIALLNGSSLEELVERFVSEIRHQMVDVRHIDINIRSIYSFNTSTEEQAEDAEIYTYRGIVAMPVSKNTSTPPHWRTNLQLQIIRMCRLENIPLILKLQRKINWWEVLKTALVAGTGAGAGAVIGTGIGAIIGAIVGAAATAPIGGVGAVPTAAGGAALGSWIGTIAGGGGAGVLSTLTKIALTVKSRLKSKKTARERIQKTLERDRRRGEEAETDNL